MSDVKSTNVPDFTTHGDIIIARAVNDETEGRCQPSIISDSAHALLKSQDGRKYDVIIDFSDIKFVSTAVAGNLIRLKNTLLKYGKSVVICSPTREVATVLELVKIDDFIFITSSKEAAISWLHTPISQKFDSLPKFERNRLRDKKNRINFSNALDTEQFSRLTDVVSEPPDAFDTDSNKWSEYLTALLDSVPKLPKYEEESGQLADLHQNFRQQLAARLQPALKEEMQRRPHATSDDKKKLVHWTNAELKRFDLTIRHPKTGLPAAFAPTTGNDPKIGSFELRGKDNEGKEKTFTTPHLATLLDSLELMEAPPRREALAEWNDRVGKQPRGRRR